MNFLLNIYNSGVAGDVTSSDGIPSGVASGLDFDTTAFIIGIIIGVIVGAIITLSIIAIVKYVKFIIKDNKEMKEYLNSQENDE